MIGAQAGQVVVGHARPLDSSSHTKIRSVVVAAIGW
jgi:hypothetical protein